RWTSFEVGVRKIRMARLGASKKKQSSRATELSGVKKKLNRVSPYDPTLFVVARKATTDATLSGWPVRPSGSKFTGSLTRTTPCMSEFMGLAIPVVRGGRVIHAREMMSALTVL